LIVKHIISFAYDRAAGILRLWIEKSTFDSDRIRLSFMPVWWQANPPVWF
jgi:hypothetical protein